VLAQAASGGMVVSSQHLATEVGVRILQQGGNAIDAAVAIAYALAVVEPCCGNLGGGGFMLIHLANGKNVFLNFREKAPLAINPGLYQDTAGHPQPQKIQQGYLAVAVPGTVLGLNHALSHYGHLSLLEVIRPALELAKQGFILSASDAQMLQRETAAFTAEPNIAAIFLPQGKIYQAGDRLVQKNLAHTLETISNKGSAGFYQGTIAAQIVAASNAHGGVLQPQDFQRYTVQELPPVVCEYRGYQIVTAPPPSSGGITLCEMLNVTEAYPLSTWGYHKLWSTHYVLEAMRYAYADRNAYLGDPDFVHNPVNWLLSKQHAQAIQNKIDPFYAGNSATINTSGEKMQTTHFSVMDRAGNAVAVTYTLNGFFGSKIIAGNTGFFLNNEMDDFSLQPGVPNMFKLRQGNANSIQPEKRPLSSMTPTIVLKNNQVVMVLGAPGGSTIPTQVLETLENMIDFQQNLKTAVDAPRYHFQGLPDQVYIEPYAFSFITQQLLKLMGYQFQLGSPFGTLRWGAVAAILRDPATGKLTGAIDQRRPSGSAMEVMH